jgi:hypothetical protein
VQSAASGQGLPTAKALPLAVVSTTPPFLITPSADPVSVESFEFIRVVFSRAVLPIGTDAENPPLNHTPFTLSGSVQGTFRWVNSYVAEFRPNKEWITDISMKFSWNKDLITWDGVKLVSDGLKV